MKYNIGIKHIGFPIILYKATLKRKKDMRIVSYNKDIESKVEFIRGI